MSTYPSGGPVRLVAVSPSSLWVIWSAVCAGAYLSLRMCRGMAVWLEMQRCSQRPAFFVSSGCRQPTGPSKVAGQ
eukprot:10209-Pelagomonas_calceolata.AAC.7